MNPYTRKLQTFQRRLVRLRDAEIRRFFGRIDAWSRWLEEQVLGAVAAASTSQEALGRLAGTFQRAVTRSEQETVAFLEDAYLWTWQQGTEGLVDAVPMAVWIERHLPITARIGVGESVGYELWEVDQPRGLVDFEIDPRLQRIIDGKASDEEARRTVADLEFGTPTREQVEQTLNDRAWPDGKTVSERIRTVQTQELWKLEDLIRTKMTGDITGASAIKALEKPIRALVGNDPGKTTGMNYRARSIARTEAVRVAEDALRQSWESASDLFAGIRTFTAADGNVRESHRHWHDKLYYRTSTGDYIATDGERLPRFPAGPNCRCWSTPELRDDITAGAPERNLGAYDAALARFEGGQ